MHSPCGETLSSTSGSLGTGKNTVITLELYDIRWYLEIAVP